MSERAIRWSVWPVVFGLGAALAAPAGAQQAAAAPPAAPDRAQVENYARIVKTELERAQARVGAVTAQLVALDEDIEARIGRMVSLLSSVRDSTDTSSTRMRQAKEDALNGLKATAVYYAQERDRRKKEMGNRYSPLEDEELAKNVAALNARIETRVTQSLDIAASLVQHQEGAVERYRNTDTEYDVETREQRKLERDARESAGIKTDLVADLRASIDKLSRDVKAREEELRTAADPKRKEQLTQDIGIMRRTIAARRSQIEAAITAPQTSARPVGSKGAFEMDKMLDEMTAELRRDFARFKSLVSERDQALARVKPLKERLEKVTAMLEPAGGAPAEAGAIDGKVAQDGVKDRGWRVGLWRRKPQRASARSFEGVACKHASYGT